MEKTNIVTGSTMNFKANLKYFKQKKVSTIDIILTVIGIAFIFAGIVLVVMGGYMTLFGIVAMIVGVVLPVIVFSGKIKDIDVDDSVKVEVEYFKERFDDTFLPTGTHREQVHTENLKKRCTYLYLSTYCFDRDDLLVKKGTDNKIRSSLFCMNNIYLFAEKIAFGKCLQSLISDEAEDTFVDAKYDELDRVELVPANNDLYEGIAKYVYLRIIRRDGSVMIETPVIDNAQTDDYVDQLTSYIRKAAKLRAEKEAEAAKEAAEKEAAAEAAAETPAEETAAE